LEKEKGGAAGPALGPKRGRGGARWAAAKAAHDARGGGGEPAGLTGQLGRSRQGGAAGPKGEEREEREKKRFPFLYLFSI
jgi:hypothetical protein